MVKGVNKRVIEVNQTGSKFFEKIVFFVTPEYSDLSTEQLHRATENFSLNLREYMGATKAPTIRKRRRLRKKRVIGVSCISALVLGGLVWLIAGIL